MVFCHSRKEAKALAQQLVQQTRPERSDTNLPSLVPSHGVLRRLRRESKFVESDAALASCISSGVAFHSAGLSLDNRRLVERLFREGIVSVLCTTTTLAMGVNLPAHLVVIKSTQAYQGAAHGYRELPKSTMLQMMGRAGRPQHDTTGVVVIMVGDCFGWLFTRPVRCLLTRPAHRQHRLLKTRRFATTTLPTPRSWTPWKVTCRSGWWSACPRKWRKAPSLTVRYTLHVASLPKSLTVTPQLWLQSLKQFSGCARRSSSTASRQTPATTTYRSPRQRKARRL